MIFVNNRTFQNTPGGGLGCLVGGILSLVLLYFVLKGLYAILYWAAPALFVLALIINWRSVADTGRGFLDMLSRNPLGALLIGALCVVAFPVFALYLFLKALGYNRLQRMQREFGIPDPRAKQREEEEFTDFEEIISTPKSTSEDELPPPPTVEKNQRSAPPAPPGNPYDDLFEK
jgi:hypothetical protein